MKLICPNCHYQRPDDAPAEERLSSSCVHCGTPLEQVLWPGFQSPLLQNTTTASASAAAPVAVVDQGIMENQNAYAPSVEHSVEDVLEIPRPLRSTQHAGEQTLVLEDVIPVPSVHELSPWEEGLDPQMPDGMASDHDMLASDDDDDEITLVSPSAAALDIERQRLAGTDVFVAAKASEPDYEGYRAWVRIAPLLLLLGALAFFSLYYLGNRMGEGGGQDTAQNAATNPAPAPETQAAAPATTSPQVAESAPPPATAKPAESSVVGASAETQKPAEQSKVVTAKTEAPPAEPAAAPATPAASAAPVVTASAAPTASSSPASTQSVGNFTVQVGSYNDAAQAEERAGRLRSSGIEARVVRAEIPRRGVWYRVQAGRFASQEEASRYATEIKGKGATDNFIITAAQ